MSVTGIAPTSAAAGTTPTLTVSGSDLSDVTAVGFSPPGGITVGSPLIVNPGGTELTVPLTLDAGATSGIRVLNLTTPSGGGLFAGGLLEVTP